MNKRITATLLSVAMLLSLLPTSALAVDDQEDYIPEETVSAPAEDTETPVEMGDEETPSETENPEAGIMPLEGEEEASAEVTSDSFKTSGTITLEKDTTLAATAEIPTGVTVTLDLNGHTLTGPTNTTDAPKLYVIINNGTLTIKDSKGGGKITATPNSSVTGGWIHGIHNFGDLTIEDGEITSNTVAIWTGKENTATKLTINGGSIKGGTYGVGVEQNSEVVMNGGTVEGATRGYSVNNPATEKTITINDGTVTGGKQGVLVFGGTLNVTGGAIISTDDINQAAIYANGDSTEANKKPININITGGKIGGKYAGVILATFKDNNGSGYSDITATIDGANTSITGGLAENGVDAVGSQNSCPGVFVFNNQGSIDLTIKGGSIKGKEHGVTGNGSQLVKDADKTNITISGGTITGCFGETEGAGIYHPHNGNLTITGGTINGNKGSAVEFKSGSGKIGVSNSPLLTTTATTPTHKTSTNGESTMGFALVLARNAAYTATEAMNVNLTGGTYDGYVGVVTDNNATNNSDRAKDTLTISGGYYKYDPFTAITVGDGDSADNTFAIGTAVDGCISAITASTQDEAENTVTNMWQVGAARNVTFKVTPEKVANDEVPAVTVENSGTTVTSQDGVYTLLPGGLYTYSVTHKDTRNFGQIANAKLAVEKGTDTQTVAVNLPALKATFDARFVVTDSETKKPVEGVTVEVTDSDDSKKSATTDKDGVATVEGLTRFTTAATAFEYTVSESSGLYTDAAKTGNIIAPKDGSAQNTDVKLIPGTFKATFTGEAKVTVTRPGSTTPITGTNNVFEGLFKTVVYTYSATADKKIEETGSIAYDGNDWTKEINLEDDNDAYKYDATFTLADEDTGATITVLDNKEQPVDATSGTTYNLDSRIRYTWKVSKQAGANDEITPATGVIEKNANNNAKTLDIKVDALATIHHGYNVKFYINGTVYNTSDKDSAVKDFALTLMEKGETADDKDKQIDVNSQLNNTKTYTWTVSPLNGGYNTVSGTIEPKSDVKNEDVHISVAKVSSLPSSTVGTNDKATVESSITESAHKDEIEQAVQSSEVSEATANAIAATAENDTELQVSEIEKNPKVAEAKETLAAQGAPIVKIQTYLAITPTAITTPENEADAPTLTVDITPMAQPVVTTAASSSDVTGANTIKIGEPKPLKKLNNPNGIEIAITLPTQLNAKPGDTIQVSHTEGGKENYYPVVDKNKRIKFRHDGTYSPFTLKKIDPTDIAGATIESTSAFYPTLKEAIAALTKNADTITVSYKLKSDELAISPALTIDDLTIKLSGVTANFTVTPEELGTITPNADKSIWTYKKNADAEDQLKNNFHKLTVTTDGNGSATVMNGSESKVAKDTAGVTIEKLLKGNTVTLTVNPNLGYEVDTVKADSTDLTPDAKGAYTVTMGDADVIVNVTFKQTEEPQPETNTLTVNVTGGEYGTIAVKNGDKNVDFTKENSKYVYTVSKDVKTVTLTCTANENGKLVSVTGATNVNDTTYTVTMSSNVTVNVAFEKTEEPQPETNTLTVNVVGDDYGTISVKNGDKDVDFANKDAQYVYTVNKDVKTVTLTCQPNDGYHATVTEIKATATSANEAETVLPDETNGNVYTLSMGADRLITVTFAANSNGGGGGGRGSGGGGGSSANTATVRPSSNSTTGGKINISNPNAKKGDTVTVTFQPDAGYMTDTFVIKDAKGNVIPTTKLGPNEYSFVMPEGVVTIDAKFMAVTAASTKFNDVASGAYYHDAVTWAIAKGITTGMSDNVFAPESSCTRAQIVTFLWRAAGSPDPEAKAEEETENKTDAKAEDTKEDTETKTETVEKISFSDVAAGSYYEKAVQWAVANNITLGTGAGKFSPDATVTRAQTVTFLYRYAGEPAPTGSSSFTDVTSGQFYTNAVQWALANKITTGKTESLFAPADDCTRAQIVTFLYRDLAV